MCVVTMGVFPFSLLLIATLIRLIISALVAACLLGLALTEYLKCLFSLDPQQHHEDAILGSCSENGKETVAPRDALQPPDDSLSQVQNTEQGMLNSRSWNGRYTLLPFSQHNATDGFGAPVASWAPKAEILKERGLSVNLSPPGVPDMSL